MPPTDHGLIATLTYALGFAFIGGFLARLVRLPPIVGYLAAGIAVGPFTPGFVADQRLATELAEIGVILLMFGVGVHFSMLDLLRVRSIAVPGAVVQIIVATALTVLLAQAWGWPLASGLVLGLAISVASTVVLVRALGDRGILETAHGRIAVGWLVVEDLVTVVVLVLLPPLAVLATAGAAFEPLELASLLGITIGKVAALALLMFFVGARAVPWLLERVARTGSRELFTLGVLALAIGIAFGASALFGVSVALGAFLAGAAVSGSDMSHHAAAEALPLRDAFAVLFFVSVGMLFDPTFVLAQPLAVLALLFVIVVGKSLAALGIVLAFGYPPRTALTVAVGLAQVGEFSFILSELGRSLQLLPAEGHALVLVGALLSISLNPLLFRLIAPAERMLQRSRAFQRLEERRAGELMRLEAATTTPPRRHAIVCGYGGVGRMVADALARRGFTYVVLEQDRRIVEELRRRGALALYGDASNPELLARAGVAEAAVLVVAISDPTAARLTVARAREAGRRLYIVARTHSQEEWHHLRTGGADAPIWAERELAAAMAGQTLRRYGLTPQEVDAIVRGLRNA